MYKLLIADDEAIERFAFRTIVSREFPEIEVVGEASNGREVIGLARNTNPDMIIMDIKMPGINGIEATRIIKDELKDTHIIMLTAYDNFEYVQDAIQLGVDDYILKPSKRDRIIQVLRATMESIQKTREKNENSEKLARKVDEIKPLIENQLISSFVFGAASGEDIKICLDFLDVKIPPGFVMIINLMDKECVRQNGYLDEQVLRKDIYEYINKFLHERQNCVTGMVVSSSVICVMEVPGELDEYKTRLYSLELAAGLRNIIVQRFGKRVTIGIGKKFDLLQEIENSYQEALAAMNSTTPQEDVRHFGDMSAGLGSVLQYPIQKEKLLIEKIKMLEIGSCRELIEDLFGWIVHHLGTDFYLAKTYIVGLVILIIRASMENHIPEENVLKLVNRDYYGEINVIKDISSLKKWFESIVEEILARVQSLQSSKLTVTVNKVKAYINANYSKDITLEKAAELVLLSPQHFSKAFKKETGMNFVDYITEFRVERSKELLANTSLNAKEISYGVGYNDPNYFFKVFKKATGLTPGEFRLKSSQRE